MAKHEACELYIEQQIKEGLEEGKTPYYIGKSISEWVEKLFETKINPKTLETRAYRQKENTSNEVKESDNQSIDEEIEENTSIDNEEQKMDRGGKRDGAGRPSKEPKEKTSETEEKTSKIEETETEEKETEVEQPVPSKSTFNKSEIDWCDFSWNPVTGCLHDCPYCYAKNMARRFKDLYPNGFSPDFREDRLQAPKDTPLPKNGKNKVFVCSMADLFGDWMPSTQIQTILDICKENPQWTYIFLTKNPKRYAEFSPYPDNFWMGATVDEQKRVKPTEIAFLGIEAKVKFVSVEPMLGKIEFKNIDIFNWVIIGPQTNPTKQPDKENLISLLHQCWDNNIKVFSKDNLIGVRELPIGDM